MDFQNLGAKKVMVVTDGTVAKLDAMKQVSEGLDRVGIKYEVYSKSRVEPKDYSYAVLQKRETKAALANMRAAFERQSISPSHTNPTPFSQSAAAV